MGGKNIVLKIEDYELHEWSECELRGYLCGGISVITPLPAGEGTGEGPACYFFTSPLPTHKSTMTPTDESRVMVDG